MRKIAIAAVAGSALLSGIAAAGAADMRVKALPMAAPPPAFSWTGFYVGANVGGAWTPGSGGSDVGPIFPPFALFPPVTPIITIIPGQIGSLGLAAAAASSAAARSDIIGRSSNSCWAWRPTSSAPT